MKVIETQDNEVKQPFLKAIEKIENEIGGEFPSAFQEIRQEAQERFRSLPFPTPRDEEWKYTNLKPMLGHSFQLPAFTGTITEEQLAPFLLEECQTNRLVFVNGRLDEGLSRVAGQERGVTILPLLEAIQQKWELVEPFITRLADFREDFFVALNTTLMRDGVFIHLSRESIAEAPLQVVHLAVEENEPFMVHPRTLILADSYSQIKIVESFHALTEGAYFRNPVTEIFLKDGARVDYHKFQDEGSSAFHIANTRVYQKRESVFTGVTLDFGGRLVRNNTNILLDDEYCESHLYGFYYGDKRQLVDNHTLIDHARPNCQSNELYKGILNGKARGVFNGKVMVRPDAQKTNAFQSNKTLLLSDEAEMDSKPQLEIFADDVRCTHGATIGALDDEALFYLRARGIDRETAGNLLKYAFGSEVFEQITVPSLEQIVEKKLFEKFAVQ